SASAAVVREVAEEAGVTITVTGLAGVYSDPGHVLAYPCRERVYQQFAVCFHAFSPARDAQPDHDETSAAAWFDPEQATQLVMHPAMRQRVTDALAEPHRAHFD
ncbi:MAG TPA: NUDIX domain-containing protein, partial [Pseudonocardiaceae bacterium]|nr:NUDIX domain-containing protein [Pseudonocardiaceae bacterium]